MGSPAWIHVASSALSGGELGWWLKEKVGLDALRKQLLETGLAGAEHFNVIEAEMLRLFRDLHPQDPLFGKAVPNLPFAGCLLCFEFYGFFFWRRFFGGSFAQAFLLFGILGPRSSSPAFSSTSRSSGRSG